jgi:hypothetical protein
MSTEAQINANRANAQHSTGPTSDAGKAKVSFNAVKTGLTGRAMILAPNEAAQYEALMLAYQKLYQPVSVEETALTQSIIDIVWRLDRIPALESSLLLIGRRELDEKNPRELSADPAEAEMQIRRHQDFAKDFRNLHLQETRLVRRRDRETAELRRLQNERKAKETEALDKAAQACLLAKHRNQPFNFGEFGFEFSSQQFESHLASLPTARKQQLLQEALKGEPETARAAA